ncbi:MAG: hypothetical protein JOY68_06310 [Candidatus Dormibacteraeota bacterium]|nr:hypothetical protein [Candidatus Dormibacteraeota bacterium]
MGILVLVAVVIVPVTLLARQHSPSPSNGGGGATSPPVGSPSSSLEALYRQALSAADTPSGCHYVATTSGGTATQKIVGDAGQHGGRQLITLSSSFGAEQFTLILTGTTVYFQGNVPAFEDQLGVAAAEANTLQGRWISVVAGDGPYNVLQPGITVADQAQELGLQPATSGDVSDGGVSAVRLSGTVPPQNGAPSGSGHLDIAAATHLPLVYVTSVSDGQTTISSTTTFSAWGSAVTESAPATPVAWSTLGASEPPGGYGGGGGGGGAASPTPQTL